VERSAFTRARDFLRYHPVATWSALLAGVGGGVLYLALLVLLSLYADLMVNQGAIPAFADLPPQVKSGFLDQQQAVPPEEVWPKRLEGNPEAQNYSAEKISTVMSQPPEKLVPQDQKLRRRWDRWLQDAWAEHLEAVGLGEKQIGKAKRDELARLAAADPEAARPGRERALRQEVLWRWHLHEFLGSEVDPEAAELAAGETRALADRLGADLALAHDIPNTGILSLVVRTQYRLDGALTALLARWNGWTWADGFLAYLGWLFLVAALLGLARAGLMYANSYMAALATTEAATRLRRAVYHHTYRLGTLAFRALGPAEAVGVSTRHLEAVHDGLYTWLTSFFREPVKFGLLLLFALVINFWIALAFLLCALLVWMLGGQIAAYFRRQGRAASHRAAEQLALLQESLMLMRLVKVYLMEAFNQARVERQLNRYASAQLRRVRGEAFYRPLLVFLGLLAALVLLFVAGLVVLSGELGVTSAIVLTTALVSLYLPLVSWLDSRRLLRRARGSAVVLFEFLDRPGGIGQVVEAEFLPPLSKRLEFENVTLKEPGTGRKLLQGVNLTIRAGQRVAIVGPEDMEKHALVYLIPRFLDPTGGEIRIDGKNLRWVTLDSLRAQIAIVLQHNLVFNDTVANNIGCGDKSYTLPQIIEAAKVAHAHQFIQKLPQGYETPIGEMGHPLRTGEQFRIALARAVLRDPALLILEEPAAPLDEDTKSLLDDTFTRILPGRTTVFLPHRLSTIRNCDQVFLLYNGKVEAAGEHRELLAQSELYRHLQYLEFNEFAGVLGGQAIPSG
jgi:ATP-binding cassette subfamily B protein